jgi:tetratricopeptide (TPR) repeat protein
MYYLRFFSSLCQKIAEYFNGKLKINLAIYYYFKAVELDPFNYEIYSKIEYCLLHSNWNKVQIKPKLIYMGIKIIEKIIKYEHEKQILNTLLGDLYTNLKLVDKAIQHFNLASQKILTDKIFDNDGIISDLNGKARNPEFLIIGFMKCGTTSLYDYLIQHPKIASAVKKEINYFSEYFDMGSEWYSAHFPNFTEKNLLTGEATPIYINHVDIASKISRMMPSIKLIVIIRNPVERVISSFYQTKHSGFTAQNVELAIQTSLDYIENEIKTKGLESLPFDLSKVKWEGLDNGEYNHIHILQSIYVFYLKKWIKVFQKNQLFLIKAEDLGIHTISTVNSVYRFLDIHSFEPMNLTKLNVRKYSPISKNLYNRLTKFFTPFNTELEELFNLDLSNYNNTKY